MLGRDARGGASQSVPGAASGRSAVEKEREERMQQLAAWRLQKEQQRRGNPDKTKTASGKQPFNTKATSAQSDAEKQRLLQRRKELMRPPSAKKTAQHAARATPSQGHETLVTTTATAAEASAVATGTHESVRAEASKRTRPREDMLSAAVAAHPAASQSHLQPPVTNRPLPPFSPPQQSQSEQTLQQIPTPPVVAHQSPALYASRPPPPRVVRLPEALVSDKRPPVPLRSPVRSSSVNATTQMSPLTLPDADRSAVGSPHSVKAALPSPSKAAKQVRFADQVDDGHTPPTPSPTDEAAAPSTEQRDTALDNGQDSAQHEASDDDAQHEPLDPLMDSQSSVDREIQQTEVLMSQVDELLSFHTAATISTDRVVQLHRDPVSDALLDEEIVVETRTEETSLVRVDEEIIVQAHAMAENEPPPLTQQPPLSEPEAIHPDAERTTNPIQDSPTDHMDEAVCSTAAHVTPTLYVAKPPVASAAGENPPAIQPLHPVQHHNQAKNEVPKPRASQRPKVNVRKALELTLAVGCLVFLDYFYPWSPVSKGIRVAMRVAAAVATYAVSRVVNWLWKNVLRPSVDATCSTVADANALWSPSARALQSLVLEGLPSIPQVPRNGHSLFKTISSSIADVVLYPTRPLLQPVPVIDEAAVEHRLEDLDDAQRQLHDQVKEILRTHEEWALVELERMKLRRVSHAAATKLILHETSQTMLEAVRDAKLAAAEHIQAFTNQLARELMVSIQPKLEEYEQSQADAAREHAEREAELKKEKLETAARLEILRIEMAKKQATTKLGEDVAAAQEELTSDVNAEEVDLMEVVEAAEDVIGEEAAHVVEGIEASLEATVATAASMAKAQEAVLDATAMATEHDVEVATATLLDKLQEDVAARKEELRLTHDAVKEEIMRAASSKMEMLEAELLAAEELARERLQAEETLLQETAEAQRALDALFVDDAEKLERELVAAAEVAATVELMEVAQLVTETERVKKSLETEVLKEVETLVAAVDETEDEIVSSIGSADAQLHELEVTAEQAIDAIAAEELERQQAERVQAAATIDSVAAQVEQAIASTAGVDNVTNLLSRNTATKAGSPTTSLSSVVAKKFYDETEFRHMVLLSIGFVMLAVATAFVLYPRYVRLAVVPVKDPKQWVLDRRRRRRRRSWQRPAELSDSEVEEVILLQTGSSSDDGLSETNEPEPEAVESVSRSGEAADRQWQTTASSRTLRTSSTLFSRQYAEENERPEAAQQREAHSSDEQASDTPQRRGLRRRARRAS